MWDTSVSTWQMSSLLTAGPVETFLHLKGFGGFGLFVITPPQSLVSHSVWMKSIVGLFFLFPKCLCSCVLFCLAAPHVPQKLLFGYTVR